MNKRNTGEHPLQFIRVTCGLTQAEFAAELDISVSNLSKRETFYLGFEDIPDELRRRVFRQFGAVILTDDRKKPGQPGHFLKVTGFNRQPFTKDYWEEHRRERLVLVKYPPADVLKAVDIVAQLCTALKREVQFADALVSGLKGLCNSDRFKIGLAGEIKKLLKTEPTAAAWLCTLLDDDELRRQIPDLPSMLAHQMKVAEKAKKIPGVREVFVNGKPI